MREHVRVLGILNIVMGCLVALIGIGIFLVMGGVAGIVSMSVDTGDYIDGAIAAPIVAAIGMGVAVFFLILAAPAIVGGWGLMKFKSWARILMIVVSVLHLFHIPLGTALGLYGLWVLLNHETQTLFETGGQTLAQPATPYPVQTTYRPPQPPTGV
jgi:hypothetical protein